MNNPASNFANAYTDFFQQVLEYWTDAAQRGALYMDAMRKRGNIYIERSVQGKPALLKFEHELLIDGRLVKAAVQLFAATGRPGLAGRAPGAGAARRGLWRRRAQARGCRRPARERRMSPAAALADAASHR